MSIAIEIAPEQFGRIPTDRILSAGQLETMGGAMVAGFAEEQVKDEPPTNIDPDVEFAIDPTDVNVKNLFAPELSKNPVSEIREVGGSDGFYNGTALKDGKNNTYLLGRKVLEAAPHGQPDVGSLVLARLNPSGDIESTKEVWNPDGEGVLLEDLRACQANGKIAIGLTALDRTDGNRTYPAVMELGSIDDLLEGQLPAPRIIKKFGGGDQTTPLGGDVEGKNATTISENLIAYRSDAMNHALQVFDYTKDDAVHVGFIDFPENIPWAEYKIGTTTPPEWLNDSEAFFVFHGITIVDDLFVYAIGTARLLREVDENGNTTFSVDNISRAPIITPDSFPKPKDGEEVELHPDIRRVTYSCGGVASRNDEGELVEQQLFVNRGDKSTWSVVVEAATIVSNWDRAESPVPTAA